MAVPRHTFGGGGGGGRCGGGCQPLVPLFVERRAGQRAEQRVTLAAGLLVRGSRRTRFDDDVGDASAAVQQHSARRQTGQSVTAVHADWSGHVLRPLQIGHF